MSQPLITASTIDLLTRRVNLAAVTLEIGVQSLGSNITFRPAVPDARDRRHSRWRDSVHIFLSPIFLSFQRPVREIGAEPARELVVAARNGRLR